MKEVKENIKGHRKLQKDLRNDAVHVIGKRHAIRIANDVHGRGIVRSNQESTNLRLHDEKKDNMHRETFRTAAVERFPGIDLTNWREAIFASSDDVKTLQRVGIDRRNPRKNTPIFKNIVFAYGHRPQEDSLW